MKPHFHDLFFKGKNQLIPAWVPVLFGILTPIGISTQNMLAKHLAGPNIRFNPTTLSFSAYLLVNTIVMICAIVYWVKTNSFDQRLFWLGLAGSIINTLGIVCA